jgi:regulator of sigma E protease
MIIIWIVVSLLLFTIIVLIHELWHFGTSRLFDVKVEEFWLWIPPKAKKLFKDKKWTIYTLNWLPLWGFVRLKWESLENLKNKNDKDALINKPVWQQIIIILAWVFMNFLLAIIIFSVLFFIWVKPIWINTKIETNLDLKLIPTYEQAIDSWLLIKNPWIAIYPIEWSIAEIAWIKEWDILIEINWIKINNIEETIKIISENAEKEIELKIQSTNKWSQNNTSPPTPLLRGEGSLIRLVKITPWNDWKIWSYLSENVKIDENFEYKYTFIQAIKNWYKETYNESILTIKWIWLIVQKIFNPKTPEERDEAISNVSWPIGLVDFISSSLSAWLIYFMIIWAIISINLWVFNLLPIPALDGWRFIFILINLIFSKIFGKKAINEKLEWFIHIIFFLFLIALSLIIAYNDISKIISN